MCSARKPCNIANHRVYTTVWFLTVLDVKCILFESVLSQSSAMMACEWKLGKVRSSTVCSLCWLLTGYSGTIAATCTSSRRCLWIWQQKKVLSCGNAGAELVTCYTRTRWTSILIWSQSAVMNKFFSIFFIKPQRLLRRPTCHSFSVFLFTYYIFEIRPYYNMK